MVTITEDKKEGNLCKEQYLPLAFASFTACRISSARASAGSRSRNSDEPSREALAWSPVDIRRSRSAKTCFSCSAREGGGP